MSNFIIIQITVIVYMRVLLYTGRRRKNHFGKEKMLENIVISFIIVININISEVICTLAAYQETLYTPQVVWLVSCMRIYVRMKKERKKSRGSRTQTKPTSPLITRAASTTSTPLYKKKSATSSHTSALRHAQYPELTLVVNPCKRLP